jgi:hypothetical protein
MRRRSVQLSVSPEMLASLDILRTLIDFQPPSWLGRLNKSSWLNIQPGEYSRGKSIRQRFDGACDEPKPALRPPILPPLKRRSSTPELNLTELFQDLHLTDDFQDQNRCITAKSLDGSSEHPGPLPVASTLPHRSHHSDSSELFAGPSLKKLQSSDSVRSSCSLKSLDRFLPRRPALNSAATSFRANKDPQSLSPEEKLLRHSGASTDPFNRRRRATSPTPQPAHLTGRRNISANRSGGAGKEKTAVVIKHI